MSDCIAISAPRTSLTVYLNSYDEDEAAAPPTETHPAPVPEPEEPDVESQPPVASTQTVPQHADDTYMNEAVVGDVSAQSMGNGYGDDDQNMGYGGLEESHEPIGMKEDG